MQESCIFGSLTVGVCHCFPYPLPELHQVLSCSPVFSISFGIYISSSSPYVVPSLTRLSSSSLSFLFLFSPSVKGHHQHYHFPFFWFSTITISISLPPISPPSSSTSLLFLHLWTVSIATAASLKSLIQSRSSAFRCCSNAVRDVLLPPPPSRDQLHGSCACCSCLPWWSQSLLFSWTSQGFSSYCSFISPQQLSVQVCGEFCFRCSLVLLICFGLVA